MTDDNKSRALASRDRLEVILDPEWRAGDDTDVKDFLLVAGFEYYDMPAYEHSARPDLKAACRARYAQRRHSPADRNMQTRISNALNNGYHRGQYRTIGELRRYVLQREHHRNLGKRAFSVLDHTLAEHGMDPLMIRYVSGIHPEHEDDTHVQSVGVETITTKDSLEAVFVNEGTLKPGMDVFDFLLLAGLGYRQSPAYLSSRRNDLQIRAQRLYHARNPVPGKKRSATTLYNTIRNAYEQQEFQTLEDAARAGTLGGGYVWQEMRKYYLLRGEELPEWLNAIR